MLPVPRAFFVLTLLLVAVTQAAHARQHHAPVNGTCGSSNLAKLANVPGTNLCITGTASAVTGRGPWSWDCAGSHGGTTSQCSAQLLVTGSCGPANGVAASAPPTTGLCTSGTASTVSGSEPWTWSCSGNNGASSAGCSTKSATPNTSNIAASPMYGVTLDDVSNVSAELNSLKQLTHTPTVRIVFDTGEPPSYYLGPIQTFRTSAHIMGELVDSSYMPSYTISAITAWTQKYTQSLHSVVDIWEIGNEVNGNWLSTESNGADVLPKIEAMYDVVTAQGGAMALTFFYEGEPTEQNNCIASDQGGNDMFTWINDHFQMNLPASQRPVETERIRLNLNYALISWYPDQCPGEVPNWPWVYTKLASIFPNAKVGFGELGTANPQNGSAFELNEIKQYYPMAHTVVGLPASYIGGYFWWYFAEEMVPAHGLLWNTLNTAIQ
jgi:hypothetical protein